MVRKRSLLTRFFSIGFALAIGMPIPLCAQNICKVAPLNYPCLEQPKEGDTTIKGQLTGPGQTLPAGATVSLQIEGVGVGPAVQVKLDGSFSFESLGALNRYNKIMVIQSAPATPPQLPLRARG